MANNHIADGSNPNVSTKESPSDVVLITKEGLSWKEIDWASAHIRLNKLQRSIYKASKDGELSKVRRLQHLLVSSSFAKLIVTRKVTQNNQGKNTAGVDGVKKLAPKARWALAKELKIPTKASPLRRVWIPKPGSTEKRSLGIPTLKDRALQCLMKLGLEPEWEAKFESDSYGFRPKKSAIDGVAPVKSNI